MRNDYIDAFRRGLGHEPQTLLNVTYPSLTVVGGERLMHSLSIPVSATCRTIGIRRMDSREAAVDFLIECAQAGAGVCLDPKFGR